MVSEHSPRMESRCVGGDSESVRKLQEILLKLQLQCLLHFCITHLPPCTKF